ncbi:MAG TPA: tetratricopeptide repeat protein, partial [Actinomycetota bacterium]|nr:tetratricopeptide repeat protein [Actinomycetota bacterium]
MTYWALAEMVRGRADILEGEERASAAAKLHDAVERYVSDPEERHFVEPRLSHLIGLEERAASDKNDLFAGWRLFFERLALEQPVLMVFEDVQWADPSLLEFVDYLLDWSRNSPLFVVTAGRPDAERPGLTSSKRNATSIYLEPLSRGAMETMLTGLVPGLPEEISEKILERAEGVPLYAVETVRMLLDRGLLVQEGPVYRPAGPIEALEVPETLQSLIAARLDGLTANERRAVQDASVLGKTFTAQALAALSEIPLRDLEPILASLLAKEVLTVQADPRSPERGQYGFLQDLVRTVAYETLAKRDRKAKHLRVAEYLEHAWGNEEEEIVEVVASHYVQAYELAPDADDASKIRDKARSMLVRAAERAASLAAAEEAETYFQRAAGLADSSLERAELLERAGQMAVVQGHPDEASEDFEEASRLFAEAGQSHHAARVEARLAEVDQLRNQLDRGLERMRKAYAVLSGDEPDPDLAMVAAQLGRYLTLTGAADEAQPVLEEALTLAEHLQLWEIYSQALNTKALRLLNLGRLDESSTLQRRALAVALEHGFTAAAMRSYNNLSVALEAGDNFKESMDLSQAALDFSRRAGDRGNELNWLVGSISMQVALGRWDEALARASEATAMEELSSLEWVAAGLVDLGALHVRRGEISEAEKVVESQRRLETSDHVQIRADYLAIRAELLAAT